MVFSGVVVDVLLDELLPLSVCLPLEFVVFRACHRLDDTPIHICAAGAAHCRASHGLQTRVAAYTTF